MKLNVYVHHEIVEGKNIVFIIYFISKNELLLVFKGKFVYRAKVT